MKKLSVILLGILLCICIAPLPIETQAAETEGYLTYTITDGEVTITDCDEDATGKIVIPDTIEGYPVTKIGEGAFWDCTGIKEIVVPNSITVIPNAAFRECETLEKITLPDGITSIGNGAFYECEYLTSIDIPESVTSIGGWAFLACYKLSAITIPEGIQEIKDSTFAYCNSLTDVTIPESVTTIGAKAFSGCPLSADFVLSKNISSIGDGAFSRGCGITIPEDHPYFIMDEYGVLFNRDKTKLILTLRPIIGKYEVPEGVQTIQGYAFSGCNAMTEIVFPDTVTKMGPYALTGIGAGYVRLPEGLTVVESYLLATCRNLIGVYIPDSVKRIEDHAFDANYDLRNIRISNNLEYIGEWAFQNVYVGSISLPASLQEIAKGAFSTCTSLNRVTFCGTTQQWKAITIGEYNEHLQNAFVDYQTVVPTASKEGYLSYAIMGETVAIIGCDPEASGEIVIPDTIEGYPVTSIISRAFSDVMNRITVILPNQLKFIGSSAFEYSGVESIMIPDSVTSIGGEAFRGCWNLTDVVIGSGVTMIPYLAFQECRSLENVTLSDGITTIQAQAFYECYALKSIQLPAALKVLGNNVFKRCESLTSIVIPDGVTVIPAAAFDWCSSLTEVVLPYGLTTIGSFAFSHCKMNDIDIPDTVTSIEKYAFYKCSELTKVLYGGDQTQWNAITIGENNEALQNAQVIFHVWDEGVVSVEATCGHEGIKVYTCTTCGKTKNITLPKTLDHRFETKWSADESKHWHDCEACDAMADLADHVPSGEATVDAPQICTVCGYEITPKLEKVESPCDMTSTPEPEEKEPSHIIWIVVGAIVLVGGAVAAVVVLKKRR